MRGIERKKIDWVDELIAQKFRLDVSSTSQYKFSKSTNLSL